MRALSGKAFARILEARGWKLRRVAGSHHIYTKAGETTCISVPVHGNKALKIGLQRHLMKVAGISESELYFTPGDAGENLFCRGTVDERRYKHGQAIPCEIHPALFSKLSVSQVAKRLGC